MHHHLQHLFHVSSMLEHFFSAKSWESWKSFFFPKMLPNYPHVRTHVYFRYMFYHMESGGLHLDNTNNILIKLFSQFFHEICWKFLSLVLRGLCVGKFSFKFSKSYEVGYIFDEIFDEIFTKFLDVRSVKIDSTAMGGVVCYAYGYAAGNGLVNIKLVNSPGISPLFKRIGFSMP